MYQYTDNFYVTCPVISSGSSYDKDKFTFIKKTTIFVRIAQDKLNMYGEKDYNRTEIQRQ